MTFDHPWAFLLIVPAAILIVRLKRAMPFRAAAAVLAVIGVSGPGGGASVAPPVFRVYLLDASASVGGPGEGLALAKADAADLRPEDRVAVFVVADGARVELAPSSPDALRALESVRTRLPGDATRLAEAVSAAAALVPANSPGEIVVISDGRESPIPQPGRHTAATAAAAARARGLAVRTLPCGSRRRADARVDRVDAPGRVRAGERFEAVVTVSASFPTRARVTLGAEAREVALAAGEPARVAFARAPVTGAIEWLEARVDALDWKDALPGNDRGEAAVIREGALSVLVLAPEPGRAAEKALGADSRFGTTFSPKAVDLALYSAIVLDGLRASDLGDSTALTEWIANGGGLVALGGDDGFGAGGFGSTPLDAALPVKSAPEEGFTLVVLLDASGSMNEASGARTKLADARDALRNVVNAAREGTSFGIVSFSDRARTVASGQDRPSILRAIETIDATGPTALLPALEAGLRAAGSAGRRHVVLATDGKSGESEDAVVAAARAITATGATLSAIAYGTDANIDLLRKIAGDRLYIMETFSELARLLREDLAREQGLTVKGTFAVNGLPDALQLNTVEAKPDAQVLLKSGTHTLAAIRPHGRGQAAALATALDPAWVSDPARWGAELAALTARVARESGTGRLTLETDGSDLVATWQPVSAGTAASALATLTGPDGTPSDLDLVRSAPDRFTARTRDERTGRFVLSVGPTRAAASRPWPSELAATGPRTDLLAALTGPGAPVPPPTSGRPFAALALLAAALAVLAEFVSESRPHAVHGGTTGARGE